MPGATSGCTHGFGFWGGKPSKIPVHGWQGNLFLVIESGARVLTGAGTAPRPSSARNIMLDIQCFP